MKKDENVKYVCPMDKFHPINAKDMSPNTIYSPKRALARVHSQENIINKDKEIEQINSITENRIIYKNKSVNGIPYTKKNNIEKTRNSINKSKNNNNNNINNSVKFNHTNKYLLNSYFSDYNNDNNDNNDNIKMINKYNQNLLTKKDESNYIDEKKYDIKPDIYPEIKINLRNRKIETKNKNNSVIIDNNRYNMNNSNLNNSTFNMSTIHQFLINETRDGRIVEALIS